MIRTLGAALALFGASAVAALPPVNTPPPTPPKLVVLIVVDQLSADLWDEYRSHFNGGLARLGSGTVYRNGYQAHSTTETCPGHAAIATGDRPARNGIIANSWMNFAAPRADKLVYCAEDERVAGNGSGPYRLSAVHLRTPTLGDRIKAASPAAKVVSIAGKDRSAVMLGGHTPDHVLYWEGSSFHDVSGATAPRSLAAVNAAVAAEIATAQPPLIPPPHCAAKATPIAVEDHAPVGAGAFARRAGDSNAFRTSPEADGAALALAAATVREMGLGIRYPTSLLAIGLSATDYVGHAYGTQGQEMCLQLMSLDRDLGDFFARLDSWGVDYAVALSSDHGALDLPERARLHGAADSARVDLALTPRAIGKSLAARTGISGPLLINHGVAGDLYLSPALKGRARERALAAVAAEYRVHPQVEAAWTKDEIESTPLPSGDPTRWSLVERARASFDSERSGDLYVVLKPEITAIGHATGSVATHGSPWDHDRRVPILFWRRGEKESARNGPVEVIDIVPTLIALLNLPLKPGAVDGKCLEVFSTVRCPTQ